MVGIVIVAHSRKLAEGVKELADQMSQGRVSIVAAGGLDNNNTIGTSVDRILKAINDAYQDEGVLVLMDLGSAVLSTKMAIQMLPPEKQAKVVMSEAPIVEGSIAAVVEASIGSTLEKVDSTARNVVTKAKVTGQIPLVYIKSPEVSVKEGPLADKIVLTLTNKMGLHARPAALFVQSASKFKSNITVEKDGKKVNAKSILGVLSLGAEKGAKIKISVDGEDKQEAIRDLKELIENKFGEEE